MLPIKGFQKTSLIDYPGKMCSVVFLADCNFRCPFCQNPDLILNPGRIPTIKQAEIFEYLEAKRKWVDGVCVTGGEPTLHKDLPDFCAEVKKRGFLVKLDTNGTNPAMVRNMIKRDLVDFIAMDIKGPIEAYDSVAGVDVNKSDVRKTVEFIRSSGLDYEFRSTILPRLHKAADLKAIGEWLRGSKRYALQQFRPLATLDKSYEKEPSYSEDEMKRFGEMLKPYFGSVEVRT
jgi:pyruvate formate lyase activating enzyme